MAEFVTIDRAIRTCYIILLGELDWEEMVARDSLQQHREEVLLHEELITN